jgi:TPR repeat protein
MKKSLAMTSLLLILSGVTAHAGLDEGKTAYTREDYATALKEFRAAADQGNAEAQTRLGALYMLGRGVAKDEAEALKWYRKAVDQGYAPAQRELGLAYQLGQGVTKDYAEAVN